MPLAAFPDMGAFESRETFARLRSRPLTAPEVDLARLPPSWVFTAQYDPLRDEGRRYAAAMQTAGVDVELSHGSDMIHGVFGMTLESGAEVRAEAASVLRRAFARSAASDERLGHDVPSGGE